MGERFRIRISEMKLEGINDPEARVIGETTREQLGVDVTARAGKVYEFEMEADDRKAATDNFVKEWVDKFGGVDILYQYDVRTYKMPSKMKIYKRSPKAN